MDNDATWLQEFVESKFKDKSFKFYPLNFQDTFDFLELFTNDADPRSVVRNNFDKVKNFIAKSLKVEVKKLEDVSAGFIMWGFKNIFEAIDFEYLIESSRDIREKFQTLFERLEKSGTLPVSSESSAEKKDGPPVTS